MSESHPNPLLRFGTVPAFNDITVAHVGPAVSEVIDGCESAVAEIERLAPTLTASELAHRLEPVDDRLGWVWTLVNHLNSVKTSDELRSAIEESQPKVVAFTTRVAQSVALFKAYRRCADASDFADESAPVKRIVTQHLRAAEHAGVGLEGEAKEAFNTRRQRLAQLSLQFGNHTLDATKAFELVLTDAQEVDGLPASARGLAAQNAAANGSPDATPEAGPWRVTLDYPSYVPFMKYSTRRDLREKLYRAFVTRASSGDFDNGPIVEEILALRQAQAKALGFDSYAALSIDSKMAPTVGRVQALLDDLHGASKSAAEREHGALEEFAASKGGPDKLQPWDVAFWARSLREARFDYSDEQLKPYFSLPNVLKGLFDVSRRLFGIRVERNPDVAGWHDDVRFYDVFDDSDGQRVAGFFLDPFSRPANKRGGAWMNECVVRSVALATQGATFRVPVAYLVCNQSPPVGNTPSLMTFNEVNTLFHEFGHGLQHMLTKVDIASVAGINGVEWDAVELPSQFMENWATHRPTLLSFARHYETGEPLPSEFIDKILAAKTFRAGSGFLRQLYFAQLDLALHRDFAEGGDSVSDIKGRVIASHTVVAPIAEDRFLCAFGHLFAGGYAAGYYSYKWAEVLSADAFGAFEDAGLDDDNAVAETGRRFRDTVLALGGSVEPMEVFVRFRGREPSTDALLRHNGLS